MEMWMPSGSKKQINKLTCPNVQNYTIRYTNTIPDKKSQFEGLTDIKHSFEGIITAAHLVFTLSNQETNQHLHLL